MTSVVLGGCGGSEGDSGKSTTNNTTNTTLVVTGGLTTGGGVSPDGGPGGGGGVIVEGDAACVAEPRQGEQIPLDLYFMVDKSGSMTCPVGPAGMSCTNGGNPMPGQTTRWQAITQALNSFAASSASAGLGAGMNFFPQMMGNTLLCTPANYSTPAVAIADLPGVAPQIAQALMANMPAGNTPTTPALNGAIAYAQQYAMGHPGRGLAVILATDGVPTECTPNNTVQTAAAAARNALMGTPSIKTYVLGVGPSLMNLNQIAAAGGTNAAYLVDSGNPDELLNALNAIRSNALTCDYKIPATPGKMLDYTQVNVKTRIGVNGMEVLIRQVANMQACGADGGWYYDSATAPTRITLCPTTCSPLLMTPESRMTVLIGCRTVIVPPN